MSLLYFLNKCKIKFIKIDFLSMLCRIFLE